MIMFIYTSEKISKSIFLCMYIYIGKRVVNVQIVFEHFLQNEEDCCGCSREDLISSVPTWKASPVTQFSGTVRAAENLFVFQNNVSFFNLGNTFIFFKEEAMQRVLPKQEIVA